MHPMRCASLRLRTLSCAIFLQLMIVRSSLGLATQLRNSIIDILILAGEALGEKTLPLLSERVFVAVPEANPLAAREVVFWTDLRTETILLSSYDSGRELENLVISKLVSPGDTRDPMPYHKSRPEARSVAAGLSKKAAFYADCTEHDVHIAKNAPPITTTVPDATVSTMAPERFGSIPRVYIECTEDKTIPIEAQRLMISDVPGARVTSLKTSHSSFFSQLDALAQLITQNA